MEMAGMRARPTRLRRVPLAAIMLALASALGACSSGHAVSAVGPLSSGNGIHDPIPRGSNCLPGGRAQAFGFQQFTNYGHSTVTVDRVVLLHPRNEHLVGSYAVPGNDIVGAVHWPPAGPGLPRTWKDRQPVHGFRLAAGKTFNMVLGVAAIAIHRRATSQGMLVYYHDSSGAYVARNFWANILSANTRTCA
jgi:hypothetical protein